MAATTTADSASSSDDDSEEFGVAYDQNGVPLGPFIKRVSDIIIDVYVSTVAARAKDVFSDDAYQANLAKAAGEIHWLATVVNPVSADMLYKVMIVTDSANDIKGTLIADLWEHIVPKLKEKVDVKAERVNTEVLMFNINPSLPQPAQSFVSSEFLVNVSRALRKCYLHSNFTNSEAKRRRFRTDCADEIVGYWVQKRDLIPQERVVEFLKKFLIETPLNFIDIDSPADAQKLIDLVVDGFKLQTPVPVTPVETDNYKESLPGLKNMFAARSSSAAKASTSDESVASTEKMTKEQLRDTIVKERQKYKAQIKDLKVELETARQNGFDEGQRDMQREVKNMKKKLDSKKKLDEEKTRGGSSDNEELKKVMARLEKVQKELSDSHQEAADLRAAVSESASAAELRTTTGRAVEAECRCLEFARRQALDHLAARMQDTMCSVRHAEMVFKRLTEELGSSAMPTISWGQYLNRWFNIATAIQKAPTDVNHQIDSRIASVQRGDAKLSALPPIQLCTEIPKELPIPYLPPELFRDDRRPPRHHPPGPIQPPVRMPGQFNPAVRPPALPIGSMPRMNNSRGLPPPPIHPPMLLDPITPFSPFVSTNNGEPAPPSKTVEISLQTPDFSVPSPLNCDDECAVCLDKLSADQTSMAVCPKCKQGYHANCLEDWLTRNSTCPSCRSKVSL